MLLFFCFCKYTLYFSIRRTLIVFLSYRYGYLIAYINSNFIIGRKITQLRGEKNFLFSQSKKQTKMMKLFQNNTPIQHLLHPLEGFAARNGMLAASVDPVGGMVWVHARCTSHNCLHVSTQHMVCNNQALINHYSSPEAFDAACQSYGGLTDDPMLKPNE